MYTEKRPKKMKDWVFCCWHFPRGYLLLYIFVQITFFFLVVKRKPFFLGSLRKCWCNPWKWRIYISEALIQRALVLCYSFAFHKSPVVEEAATVSKIWFKEAAKNVNFIKNSIVWKAHVLRQFFTFQIGIFQRGTSTLKSPRFCCVHE